MDKSNLSYRVRTDIGDDVKKVEVNINQTYDVLDILSLKIDQINDYPNNDSNFGVVVGRVIANGGLGIPNAKVTVFLPNNTDNPLYQYVNTFDTDEQGRKFNTLPKENNSECHTSVGSMESKEVILDNSDVLEVFDKYLKYTTVTNNSGDYMIYGVPVGQRNIHLDIDLSDIGILSQRPIDFIANGYSIESFDSPSKFKVSNNLNELVHIYQQDKNVQVYPFLSETAKPTITRCDFEVSYKFQTNCIFIGSIGTDKGGNAIGKNCKCSENTGKLSELTPSEGFIEMIRKTPEGKVEEYNIKGQRLIDGDGVWCYQIPMNLDYITTDEFGNTIPTDNPNKGIATRTDVRFRFSLNDSSYSEKNVLKARHLVPNNPFSFEDSDEQYNDYEFGTKTRDESFRSLYYNNVYTVKSYIPYTRQTSLINLNIFQGEINTQKHTGIKYTSLAGDNNNFPYNNLNIDLGFMYRFICMVIYIIVTIVAVINTVLSAIAIPFCALLSVLNWRICIPLTGFCLKPLGLLAGPFEEITKAFSCIPLSSSLCNDGVNEVEYYPGCQEWSCSWTNVKKRKEGERGESGKKIIPIPRREGFDACVSQKLAETNEVLSYTFTNDWVNGFLYFPSWIREIKRKRAFFGLFGKKKIQDNFCNADRGKVDYITYSFANLFGKKSYSLIKSKSCTLQKNNDLTLKGNGGCTDNCAGYERNISLDYGLIKSKTTKDNKTVFYYSPAEWNKNRKGEFYTLFATDIVNLGPISGCTSIGVNSFVDTLDTTTYKMPYPILFTNIDSDTTDQSKQVIEHSGASWSSPHTHGLCSKNDGGVFYDLSCIRGYTQNKSCVNLERICQLDIGIDESKYLPNINKLMNNPNDSFGMLVSDGFISNDEIINHERRSAFATLNHNLLKNKYNPNTGREEYDIDYIYSDNFDGVLHNVMKERQQRCSAYSYKGNYNLEYRNDDYVRFVYGNKPRSYANLNDFFETRNSFYFFFGLKEGKTALNKYNSYFSQKCEANTDLEDFVDVITKGNDWCSDDTENERNGYVLFDAERLSRPYSLEITSSDGKKISYNVKSLSLGKFGIGNELPKDLDYTKFTNIPALPNGSYTYRFEDTDGVVSVGEFNLSDTFLSFSTLVRHFNMDIEDIVNKEKTISNIANNKEGFDVNTLSLRNYGGVIVLSDFVKEEEVVKSLKLEIFAINPTLNFSDYKPLTIMDNQVFGDGLLHTSTQDGKKTYYIGVPYPNTDYKIVATELCDGVESNNRVEQVVSVKEFKPLRMEINGIDSRVFANFNHAGDYNGWDKIANIGSATSKLPNKPKILNPTYETDGTEPIYDYDSFYDVVKSTYDELTKTSSQDSPYSWVGKYLYTPTPEVAKMMASKANYLSDDNASLRDNLTEELNDIIANRLELKKTMLSTFVIYHANSTRNSVNISGVDGVAPYSVKTAYIETEYDGEQDYTYAKGLQYKTEQQFFQNLPTLTKRNGKLTPYTDRKGNVVRYTSVALKDANNTTLPKPLSLNDFKRSKDKDFLKLHFIDKLSKVTYNSWATMRHIPYFKPKDASKVGQFLDYGGFITFEMENFKVDSVDEQGNPKFTELSINGADVSVKTLNSEEDFPTRRVLVNDNNTLFPNYNIGVGNTTNNIIELEGLGEVLTITDDIDTTEVETNSDEVFKISDKSWVVTNKGLVNLERTTIKFSSIEDKGTIYKLTPLNNNHRYIPQELGSAKSYNDYSYMKYTGDNSLSISGATVHRNVNISEFEERETFLLNNIEDRYYYYILEADSRRYITPIYDFNPVKGRASWSDDRGEISVTITNLNDRYYLKNYEAKIVLVHGDNMYSSQPTMIENNVLTFSPANYNVLKNEKGKVVILIEDITGLKHKLSQ